MRYIFVVIALMLAGCPVRVDTPTGNDCHAKATCGVCAALEPCAWCPSGDTHVRGCYSKTDTHVNCEAPMLDVVESCPEDERGRQ